MLNTDRGKLLYFALRRFNASIRCLFFACARVNPIMLYVVKDRCAGQKTLSFLVTTDTTTVTPEISASVRVVAGGTPTKVHQTGRQQLTVL